MSALVKGEGANVAEGRRGLAAIAGLGIRTPISKLAEREPPSLHELRPYENKTIEVILTAAADALPGEYTIRVKATTSSRVSSVDSPELTFRLELKNVRSARAFYQDSSWCEDASRNRPSCA